MRQRCRLNGRCIALAWCDAVLQPACRKSDHHTGEVEEEIIGGDMPDSHAERRVKAQPRWEEYIRQTRRPSSEAQFSSRRMARRCAHRETHMISSISGE